MAGPNDGPLFSERQIRLAFVASGVGMVSVLVLILILATSQPQGQYAPADTSQYDATLERAAADLTDYRLLENGRATIEIGRAMELVAERGVDLQLSAATTPPEAAAATGEDAEADTAEAPEQTADDTAAEAEAEAETQADAEAAAAQEETAEDAAAVQEDAAAQDETQDDAAEDDAAAAAPAREYDAALGEQTYSNCVGCHQANGEGVAGVFPPLADWMPEVVAVDGGKEYFAKMMLWGLQGEIVIDGQSYNGAMPGWAQLSDEQIAAVLNHELMSWGNAEQLPEDFNLYTPEEIAAQRDPQMSVAEVYELRQTLELP